MACIVKSARLQDILDLVEALVADPDLGIGTYEGVVNYFENNFPDISQNELAQALVPLDDISRKGIVQHLKDRQSRLKRLQRSVNRLNDLAENGFTKAKSRIIRDKEAEEIAQIIKEVRSLAGTDLKIPPEAYGDILSRLENLTILQDAAFEFNEGSLTPSKLAAIVEEGQEATRAGKLQKASTKLREVLAGQAKKTKPSAPPNPAMEEIRAIIKAIDDLSRIDVSVNEGAYNGILDRIRKLPGFEGETVSQAHIQRVIEDARAIKRASKVGEIDGKIAEIDKQIENLNADRVSFEEVEDLNTTIRIKGLDRIIANKELELGEKRVELEVAMANARRRARAKSGFLGFDGRLAQGITHAALLVKDNAWEPFRALKFMADLSAWGVQAAPVVYSMMTDVSLSDLFRGNLPEAFHSQRDMARIFYESVFRVAGDSLMNMGKWGKTAKSTYAQKLLNDIKSDPVFPIAKRAKLQISEAGTLTSSEEVFTSQVVNAIPVMGAIKDFSEDTMVATLNSLRMLKFKQFYDATSGTATNEEYARVAEVINKMTGTTADFGSFSRGLSFILSAPKLFISRLQLMLTEPIKALGGLDLPSTAKQRKFVFQTQADRFILRQMLKSVRGYLMMTGLIAMLPGVDFEEDPRMKQFLRYSVTPDDPEETTLFVDATGGMGTLARTMLKSAFWMMGIPGGSDHEKSIFQPKDGIEVLLKGFVRYKLHPTIGSAHSAITGRDFFGDSYTLLSETTGANLDGVAPHIEGTVRAMMPILVEGMFDNARDVYEGDIDAADATVSLGLNIIGASTYRLKGNNHSSAGRQYFKEINYTPRIRYPKGFDESSKESRWTEYLKDKYKKEWNGMTEDIAASAAYSKTKLSKKQYQAKYKSSKQALDETFEAKYAKELKRSQKGSTKKKEEGDN